MCVCVCVCVCQVSTAEQMIGYFEGDQADLVVCDGAPDGQCLPHSVELLILMH